MSTNNKIKSDILLCTVYLHRLVRTQARQSAQNWAELAVLNNLEHWGGSIEGRPPAALTQKELASYEQVSQAAMSNIIRKLRDQEFVRCEKNAADSRSVLVSLTPKGRRYLAKQGPIIKEVFDPLLHNLSKKDLALLEGGMSVLSEALKSSSEVQNALRNSREVAGA